MNKIHVSSVFFAKLKGLSNVNITFEKPLTAIMGVNGAGKTTVIHALACVYKPDDGGNGENHRFPEYFIPNTDALWEGSEFHVVNKVYKDNAWDVLSSRTYSKSLDRWAPKYTQRPKRNVYYIGIDSCLPEIEKTNTTSRIRYTSSQRTDRVSTKVLEAAAIVLNKDYDELSDNEYNNKHFMGVHTRAGLRYSSLSMGTGEQRTIKILDTVIKAEAYSLILIDEIDLLLHTSALNNLIIKLHEIANEKHLQIVFTTHSLEMLKLTQHVGIQYLNYVKVSPVESKYYVYDKPSDDIVRGLSGRSERPIRIFVEDLYAKILVNSLLIKNGVSRKAEVRTFGAGGNAFSLAAGFVLENRQLDNTLIVLDGDVYCSAEQKISQIQRSISGNETDSKTKRTRALSIIDQFNLPEGKQPEEFIYDLIVRLSVDNEISQIAREIHTVDDKHQFVYYVCTQLNQSLEYVVPKMIEMIESCPEWKNYISPIEQWITDHKGG